MRQVKPQAEFGDLIVIEHGATTAWCMCMCGKMRRVPKRDLRAGRIKGCRTCDPKDDSMYASKKYRD